MDNTEKLNISCPFGKSIRIGRFHKPKFLLYQLRHLGSSTFIYKTKCSFYWLKQEIFAWDEELQLQDQTGANLGGLW